jgi:hypothetical protein
MRRISERTQQLQDGFPDRCTGGNGWRHHSGFPGEIERDREPAGTSRRTIPAATQSRCLSVIRRPLLPVGTALLPNSDPEAGDAAEPAMILAVIERGERSRIELGIALAEGRALLAKAQSALMSRQVGAWMSGRTDCDRGGAALCHRDSRFVVLRTVFGKVKIGKWSQPGEAPRVMCLPGLRGVPAVWLTLSALQGERLFASRSPAAVPSSRVPSRWQKAC